MTDERRQPVTWTMIKKGQYRCQTTHLVGIIERAESGFWWWLVADAKSGIEKKAGRTLNLSSCKKKVNEMLRRGHLKAV